MSSCPHFVTAMLLWQWEFTVLPDKSLQANGAEFFGFFFFIFLQA